MFWQSHKEAVKSSPSECDKTSRLCCGGTQKSKQLFTNIAHTHHINKHTSRNNSSLALALWPSGHLFLEHRQVSPGILVSVPTCSAMFDVFDVFDVRR